MSVLPWFRRASHYARLSLQIREQFGDIWGQAQTLHFQGVMLYAASRYGECIEMCREAVRRFDRTGDYWELNMARYQLAASLYRLGDLAAASREAWKMHASGLELGDVQASGLSVDLVSKANCGRVPQELIQAELMHDRGSDAQTASKVLQAEGVRLLAAGDDHAAVEAFQAGWDVAHPCRYPQHLRDALPALAGDGPAAGSDAAADTDAARRRRLVNRAWQAARQGLRLARRFQNDLPHCLRELGLVAAVQGRAGLARRYLEESLRVATQLGARYEHAQTSLALAELERESGLPDAQQRTRHGPGRHP